MGDISTHAEISRFVIDQVRRVVPVNNATIPLADYAFLELGNFLTDVSQFRDPPAYHRARQEAWEQSKQRARERARGLGPWLAKRAGSGDWLTAVFGKKSGPQHGALPELLGLLMMATTHMVFDDDALPRAGSLVAKARRNGPSILLEHGIPAAQVNHVLETNYTQYFPHEHLDATPLPPGQVASLRGRPEFAVGPRTLLAYLDDDLLFLSEQLTWLEARWRAAVARAAGGGRPVSAEERQFGLLQLGHILHAVEDYFFHSNLPEAHVWAAARADKLATAPNTRPSRAALLRAALRRTQQADESRSMRRLLNRRLRYPVYDGPDQLSTTNSVNATRLIYTGGFGQTDVWHTLGGALEALDDQLDLLPDEFDEYDPRNTSLVLFKMLLSKQARTDMVNNKTVDQERERHLKQLRDGEYHDKINALKARGDRTGVPVCEHAIAALLAAFDLDLRVSNKYTGERFPFPGPGALLITMMDKMETERGNSADAKDTLDDDRDSVTGLAADNGCSAENIGTHTLMSKDAPNKEPLRAEAVALAKHASASIAVRFFTSVTQPPAPNQGVDWDAELQSFIRGVELDGWEAELLDSVRRDDDQPDVNDLDEQPPPAWKPLAAPRRLTTTARLEDYYRDLES